MAASAAMPSYQQALGGPGGLPQGSLPQGSMPLPQGGLQQGGLQHGAMQQAALQQFAQHQGLPQGGLGMSMGGGHPATPPLGQVGTVCMCAAGAGLQSSPRLGWSRCSGRLQQVGHGGVTGWIGAAARGTFNRLDVAV